MKLINGETIEEMSMLSENSIDMILADLPYGTTKNKWDVIIPLDKLWEQYNRIIKDNGAILLFSQGLFCAKMIVSNEKYYRYTIVWNKLIGGNFFNANRMPLKCHENINVFYKAQPTYNPIKNKGKKNHGTGNGYSRNSNNYGKIKTKTSDQSGLKFPVDVVEFKKMHSSQMVHSTQKPVDLLEYLIKTYSNERDVVLDNTMGSGSTGVACVNTNREFIGIELDKNYFEIAKNRINEAQKLLRSEND